MDTTLRSILPDLPPELDEAGKYQMREKALGSQLHAFGQMSDEWIANMVRGLMRKDLWFEAICCASRDRIMKLSLENGRLRTALDEADDIISCAQAALNLESATDQDWYEQRTAWKARNGYS